MEEITEKSINKLLLSLPDGLSAIERAILANEGTVQSFLSVLCNTPVKVEVISQRDYPGIIVRWAKLIIEDSKGVQTVVCLAESIITKDENENLTTMIKGGQKGIGQIIKELGLQTTRRLEGFHNDAETFARTYTIQGECNIVITEVFNHRTIAAVTSSLCSIVPAGSAPLSLDDIGTRFKLGKHMKGLEGCIPIIRYVVE